MTMTRSSGEMKFDTSSYMLKPVYFAFVNTMLELFLQTTYFVKLRTHSPRPTGKIVAMIALRRAILIKADPAGEPPCTSLVQRSRMLMQKRPLFGAIGFPDSYPLDSDLSYG